MSSFLERRKQQKKLGQKYSIEGKVEQELELLEISLTNIDAIRSMANTEGWEILSTQVRDFIEQQKNLIIECASAPDKHRDKQQVCYAMMKMGQRLLGLVANALNEAPLIEERKRAIKNG